MMKERLAVVESARRWLGTPYHHRAAVLGVGVDCAQLVLEAFAGAGLEERFDAGPYSHDWHLHRSEEKYLEVVECYMRRVDDSEASIDSRGYSFHCKPADVLMFRVGRTFSHAAIVTRWPYIIHSSYPARMVEEVSVIRTPMAERFMRVYSYWGT
jgi:cell wall-associated NlpC family hydrolase